MFASPSSRRKSTELLFVAALSLAGCTSHPWTAPERDGVIFKPETARVCIDLPIDQQLPAVRAVKGWDRALHQWRHVEAVDAGVVQGWYEEWCDYVVHETESEPVSGDIDHVLAWASSVGGTDISMRRGYYEVDTTGILLHELGHAFGAQHMAGTLMNPTWSKVQYACPDAPTVAQVAAWNRVNLSMLCWCE